MAFSRRSRTRARSGVAALLGELCRGGLLAAARLALAGVGIAALAVVVVYLRLLQGPIVLPGMAQILVERVNASGAEVRLGVRDLVLALGEAPAASGLQFRDVEMRSPEGTLLLAVPRVGVRFRLFDLVHGRVEPIAVTLIEPDARIVRTEDGRIHAGMGNPTLGLFGGHAADGAGLETMARIIDGFVGDLPPIPALASLERIDVLGANLRYADRIGGREWATQHAEFQIWRHPHGARARLVLPAEQDAAGAGGAVLELNADRQAGAGQTRLHARFSGLRPEDLSAGSHQADGPTTIGGTVDGEAVFTVGRDGAVGGVEGTLRTTGGHIRGFDRPVPFDAAVVRFRTDPAGSRVTIDSIVLDGPAVRGSARGVADLRRNRDGDIQALDVQLALGGLHVDLPHLFEQPLDFDGGQITAGWSTRDHRVEIVDARLRRGSLAFRVNGAAHRTGAGWQADLRAGGTAIPVADLVAHWPAGVAGKARKWIAGHIPEGRIDRFAAQMYFGGVEPRIALDFTYSGLRAEYLSGMSAIEGAHGTGRVSYHDLFLDMGGGHVTPLPGQRLELAGSTAAIRDFRGSPAQAEISLTVSGASDAALALIDQEPLRLVRRLGRELGPVDGTAQVEADLTVPLLARLRLGQIGVEARATLSKVGLPIALSPARSIEFRAAEMDLVADVQGLRLSGDAHLAGEPVLIDWHERFGTGSAERTVSLSGKAGTTLLAAVGVADAPVGRAPEFDLQIRQAGGRPPAFTLDADLAPLPIDLAAVGWSKPAGAPAELHAEGTYADSIDVTALRFASLGLEADGSVRIGTEGRLLAAHLHRMRVVGLGSFAATVQPGPDGVTEIALSGRELDFSQRLKRGSEGLAEPLRVSLNLDRLRLSDRIELAPARGQIERHSAGWLTGRLEGWLGGEAPAAIDIDLPPARPGSIMMISEDAGAALSILGLYRGAEGGLLTLEAEVGTGDAPAITGRARIENLTVRSQSTFREVLSRGGLDSAGQEVATAGMRFRKIWIPFSYAGGLLTLTDAIAVSPALGLKLNGTVDERSNHVDMLGVLSPAYALTGALNEVPVLGKLLGGQGEGVLAMTFRLRGPSQDPRLLVNPLSMLAPGFLRKVFSRPTREVSDDFMKSISREAR